MIIQKCAPIYIEVISQINYQQTSSQTPSWKMDEVFKLLTKHDVLQNIVHVFMGDPLPLMT
jgi:hypothetical protein